MTAPAPARTAPDPHRPRTLLDIDEWVFWTRILRVDPDSARARLGYSDRRTARYEAYLTANPQVIASYYRD